MSCWLIDILFTRSVWILKVMEDRLMNLKLVRPTYEYAEQVMQYKVDMLANNDSFDGCAGLEEVNSFTEWIDFENRLKRKYGKGYVPSEVFLGVRIKDEKVVGIIDYRHPLSPFLLQYGEILVTAFCHQSVKKDMLVKC